MLAILLPAVAPPGMCAVPSMQDPPASSLLSLQRLGQCLVRIIQSLSYSSIHVPPLCSSEALSFSILLLPDMFAVLNKFMVPDTPSLAAWGGLIQPSLHFP